MTTTLPIAIIGGGPAGLAAAAQLVQYKQPFVLFEAGSGLGTHFLEYGHVRLFSTWRYNIDAASKALFKEHGIALPDPDRLPYGREIAQQYLQPLGQLPELEPFIHLNSRVVHVQRQGLDKMKTAGREEKPFELLIEIGSGERRTVLARAVIDATGTWQNPNPIVSGGVADKTSGLVDYGIPAILGEDQKHYENKRIAVVGSGHSALNSLLDLVGLKAAFPETQITWIVRKSSVEEALGGGDADQLPERGALGQRVKALLDAGQIDVLTSCFIQSAQLGNGLAILTAFRYGEELELGPFDRVIANTGSRPSFDFLREIRYAFDPASESVPALAPLIDPNVHSCGTVRPHGERELRQPEKNFYIIGAKSYGRAPTFLMATGFEQARSVVAHLSGDYEAAVRVELDLPETGVCSSRPLTFTIAGAGNNCC
ncbi:NAD(P)-binding domain-containing protein [Microbacterium sp. APC 3898]|uniref:NAD(P)-binding domain-containing protein n=2 Tax=Planococcus TaxID=1372 RepID=A0ABT7ZHM7_9BACL|nr:MULTISPECIES: NAD(P)-binding domain-containing protein [Terrabacteria group]MBD8015537.1 NAD(P)-binding domain-containing protein [Planococcus wigleyi]MDN3426655.1 NAD(P)-binding domain-containing protein [Planococcus sp. APC 4016]MDN3500381.1 NAD(P)-binding domain-containing protein [Microbacterium sp. APC 3898]